MRAKRAPQRSFVDAGYPYHEMRWAALWRGSRDGRSGTWRGALAAVEEREAPALRDWRAKCVAVRELLGRVVDPTERRVLRGEKVSRRRSWRALF